MKTINKLSSTDSIVLGDLLAMWSTNNGDTRKVSMNTLVEFVKAQGGESGLTAINTFDDLRDLDTSDPNTLSQYVVLGGDTVDDGKGGIYYWNILATQADDDFTIIDSNQPGDGRWLRLNTSSFLIVNTFAELDALTKVGTSSVDIAFVKEYGSFYEYSASTWNKILNNFYSDVSDLTITLGSIYDTVIISDPIRGGTFEFDATETINDNQVNNFNGWIRQNSDIVNTKFTGADATGSSDSITELQKAFDIGGTILIDGQYIISDRIQVKSNTKIIQTKGSWIKNTDTTETVISSRPSTDNGVFEVDCGNENITFEGLDIRGAWYGTTRPFRDNNIGINIKGRFDQHRLSEPLTGISIRITIKDCKIEGFAQSGVIADNVTRFKAVDNFIQNCGRDGIRMYGCIDFLCSGNSIINMSPGYDGAAPNLNVYGISATTVYQTPLSDFRSSEKGVISNNNIANCLGYGSQCGRISHY